MMGGYQLFILRGYHLLLLMGILLASSIKESETRDINIKEVSACFNEGTSWGFDERVNFLRKIQNADSCQNLCLESPDCLKFTWYTLESPESLICLLYGKTTAEFSCDNCVSGPKLCQTTTTTTTTPATTTITITTTTTTTTTTTITTPPPDILLESSGRAAEHQGGKMGYFDYYKNLNQRPAFKQRGGDYYLYYYEKAGRWQVGPTLGGSSKAFKQTSRGSTPPSSGWQYYDSDGENWLTDSTLRVDTSPSDPWSTCTNIKVAATGPAGSAQAKKMGNYRWGGEWLNGRKIFKGGREGDQYLRVPTGKTTWGIHSSRDSGRSGISSGKATTCPCSQAAGPSVRFGRDWWKYSDDGWHVDRSISVTCV